MRMIVGPQRCCTVIVVVVVVVVVVVIIVPEPKSNECTQTKQRKGNSKNCGTLERGFSERVASANQSSFQMLAKMRRLGT